MKIGLVSDCLGKKTFEELLQTCKGLRIEQVELGTGNWSSAPHVDLNGLLESATKRDEIKGLLRDYDISISAFNCSGNPLAPGTWGEHDNEITTKTFKLSEYFGLDNVVMMSGLPAGGPDDHYPNWIVTSWPAETQTILDYQWNKVAIPYWKELIKIARFSGIKHIALEPHGSQLMHDVENFYRLQDAVDGDKIIGFNLDPSHLFWMGADPLSVARELGDMIYHVHIKDVRIEKPVELNTLLDGKHMLQFAKRSWNFSIPGFGHGEFWWKEFIVALKMAGYDGVLSIEHEDYTIDTLEGLTKTATLLHSIIWAK
jgi:sugar phosphate isomerase/epimerase